MHDIDDLGEFIARIWDGLGKEFTIYGHTMSFEDIFIWGTLGTILVAYLREIVFGE